MISFDNCYIHDNDLGSTGVGAGIELQSAKATTIANCRLMDDQPTPTQTYGVYMSASSSGAIVSGNILSPNKTAAYSDLGTNDRVFNNGENYNNALVAGDNISHMIGQFIYNNQITLGGGEIASGSSAIDLSGSSGIFKTPTGAATFGGSSNTFSKQVTVPAGTGTQTGNVPVGIFDSTAVVTSVTTGETDAIVYTMPANTVSTFTGMRLHIRAGFLHAADANSTTAKVYFNGTVIASQASTTSSGTQYFDLTVVPLTSSTCPPSSSTPRR